MRKTAAFVWLLLTCAVMSGCWNRIELNEISIVAATAFDLEGDDWVISYQTIIPSTISSGMGMTGGGSNQSPVTVFTTRGRTIREAVNKSSSESPRWLFFAHTNILIVSDRVARGGMSQILDLYFRNPDARETVNVLITKGSARAILEQLMSIEKIPGQGIREIIYNESRNSSRLPSVMMYELAMAMTGDARSAMIPEILISGEPEGASLDALKKTSQTSKLRLGKLAVLRGDRLAGWLTKEEGLGVSFITDKVKSSILPFSCNSSDGKTYNSSFRLLTSSTKLSPVKEREHFVMNVDIKAGGYLLESDCVLDLSEPETIDRLERQLQGEIAQILEKSWRAARRLNVDVFGFADAVHRKYPKEWKKIKDDWEAVFPHIEMKPRVTVSMDRVGLSNKSFKTLKKDDGG
ncbi:Ger(x)C family spore germination protein [Paenibacillus allorhizosphaerae]|uniref:Spore germination protein B3 n=1 Tax=Paenibacillus allorhizosphaerae TaxID=2849866 RepID=A0ABN7TIZ9_9BACL|nr:Ger(x)C family spore germination protein [Paenibacillus allorhizosphaerae]CAG7635221.1 Spore germination protein B3 [Paenibacillus allorhizosphaerae]